MRKPAPPASVTRDYIFFAARRIAWRDSSGNVYYYFVDAIGSTRAVTNATGTTCFNADYYPYGQENDYNTSCTPTYKFTGYEFDAETGNYYAYARYYSPSLGRFLSADPMGGNISNPQSLNRYAYVLNNPETFIDPLGLCADGQQSVVGSNGEPGCVANPESVVDTVNGGPPPPAPWEYYRLLDEAGSNGCGPFGCPKGPPADIIAYMLENKFAQRTQNVPGRPQAQAPQQESEHCAGQALKQNAVALSLDVAGIGAGFLPGGDAVVAVAQMGVSTGGVIYGVAHNDATGAYLNASALGISALTPTAKAIGGDIAQAVPGLGAAVSAFGFFHDAYHAYGDYRACMAGVQ